MVARHCVTLLLILVVLSGAAAWAKESRQGVTDNYGPVVAEIFEKGDQALAAYTPDRGFETGNALSAIYFQIFEKSGMEFTLGLKNKAMMLEIESGFSRLISDCMRGEEKQKIMRNWELLKTKLTEAVEKYSSGGALPTFWGVVLQSFLILFREGVEAMLVVAALVTYLRRSGFADKVVVIWHGVGWALAASVGAAVILNLVVQQSSGASREAVEGITMLIAAAVLIYVSYWLFSKRDAQRWQAFIKDQMDRAITRGNVLALGFTAFLAVFREGAETILFYQALIGGTMGSINAVWVGMGLAAVSLAAVYFLVSFASVTMPLKLFFSATAVLLFIMAFTFAGKGVLELQVAKLLPATQLEGWPMISWLGIFPTLQSVLCQAVIILTIPAGWLWIMRNQSRKQRVAAAETAE